MTMLDDRPYVASDDALLPVPWSPPPAEDGRNGRYQPRHALEPAKPDRTTLWLIVVLLVTSAFVAGTTATFFASTTDSGNTFGSATLSNPAGQTIALSGSNLNLNITALGGFDGSPPVAYGSRWSYMWPTGVSQSGSSYGCSASTSLYTTELTTSGTSAASIDYLGVAGFAPGRWMCIMAHTAYPQNKPAAPMVQWFSQKDNPKASVQLGHVVQSVNLVDVAGTTSRIQQNDRLVITFNQPVDATGRPTSGNVCARSFNERVFVGLSGPLCVSNNPSSVSVLYLEGAAGVDITSNGSFTNTTWTWSGDGRTLTIDLNSSASSPISGCTTNCFRVRMDLTVDAATALESSLTPTRSLCTLTDDEDFDNGSCEPFAVGSF